MNESGRQDGSDKVRVELGAPRLTLTQMPSYTEGGLELLLASWTFRHGGERGDLDQVEVI